MLTLLLLLAGEPADDATWRAGIEADDRQQVATWIDSGWAVDSRDESGATPLIQALLAEKEEMVGLLLERGADPNLPHLDYMGMSPLMAAASRNDVASAQRLLDRGAELDVADQNGDPAINWAAYYGYEEWVDWALEHGADAQQVGHGSTIEIAMRRGHEGIVQAILKRDSPEVDVTGRTELMLAIVARQEERALELIESGAPVQAVDRIGYSALHHASREGLTRVVRALIAKSVPVSASGNPNGLSLTPVHLAAIHDQPQVLALLAEAGADLDKLGSGGGSAFAWALSEGQRDTARWLIEHGADATLADAWGITAKDFCASQGWDELVALLSER